MARICTNSACLNPSLFCNVISCPTCSIINHKNCQHVKLRSVTNMLQARANSHRRFITNICDIENGFIDQLYDSRKRLTDKYYLGDLKEKHLKIIEEVYSKKNPNYLVGNKSK